MKKRSYTIDMINGPLAGKILLFALPLMASSILQRLFNLADTLVVGRFAGSDALAAVGSCSSLVSLLVGFFIGFSLGVDVVIAQALGNQDEERASRCVHTSILFSLLCGLFLAAIGLLFAPRMLGMMNVPEEVIDAASIYLRIYFLGAPANLLYNFGAAVLRSKGDTQRSLIILTLSGVLNVLLNLVFVICFHMDTAGVALATTLSLYLSAFLVVRCLLQEQGPLHLDLRKLVLDRHSAGQIVRVGLPSGLENSMYAIANVMIHSAINSFGSAVIAGVSTANTLEDLAVMPSAAVTQAMLTFTSQNYGARKYKRIDRVLTLGTLYATLFALICGFLVTVFAHPLLSLFVPGDEAVIREGITKIYSTCPFLFVGYILPYSNVLRGMGHPVIPTVVSLLGSFVFRLLYIAYIFPLFNTTVSLYVIWPISWLLIGIVLAFFYYPIRKKEFSALAETEAQA